MVFITTTRNGNNLNKSNAMTSNKNIHLVAVALIAMVIVASIMVECASNAQDYEYMDLRDLYDMIQQNAMRPKKSPRADKGQPLRMRFGRRSDPWMIPGPIPLNNGNNLAGNPYYAADQA